ncbi:MAG: hypothetical protein KDA41_12635, partial [Planctomycetales bacterium]|nr:hypothetical protein [Planctomycetales bacterium]
VQEGLANVVKHSGATTVDIMLHSDERQVRLEIQDNGTGFDAVVAAQSPSARPSVGISSIRERVAMLDGDCAMRSAPGQGALLQVVIPLNPSTT